MICHTDTHSNERRQPTPTAVGNGLPHTPNVPLSCTDRRYYSVNLRLFSRRDLNGSPFGSTPANGNTKSNRSHGGSSGRIPTAPQVLLRAAGARTTICFEGNSSNRNSNRFWGRRGSQNTGEDCRSIGASCAGRVEEAKAPFTAPAPVIDQESRLGAVYARSGTSADTGADLQPRSGGRSAPHSQEAVIALLAFGTVAAAYVWLAYAACVP